MHLKSAPNLISLCSSGSNVNKVWGSLVCFCAFGSSRVRIEKGGGERVIRQGKKRRKGKVRMYSEGSIERDARDPHSLMDGTVIVPFMDTDHL